MHDTWGIPGPAFVGLFWTAAALVVVGAVSYRLIAFRGHAGLPDHIGPEHAAFLAGGPKLAVYASLGALRGAGAINVSDKRIFSGGRPLPRDATPLDYLTHEATAGGYAAAQLPTHPQIKSRLAQIRDELERSGMLVSPAQRAGMRWLGGAGWALIVIGIARISAGVGTGKPVGNLSASTVMVAIMLLFLARTPLRTRAGNRALAQLRQQYAHLAPARAPAFTTYGPAAAAMGIGLFGIGSLYALDPTFAADAGLPRHVDMSGDSGSSSSCSGGSSCGSSCGGGGGCGG
ncbi:uncharacterized protein (TIGR04222 family) [Mycobacterium sp. MAA66]|uniref:TIGR04222 domain-containing membrane protein n=1 Tax=Mycobacterium sp. MAA66 TaxID=3156297 RepID=UPI0035113863